LGATALANGLPLWTSPGDLSLNMTTRGDGRASILFVVDEFAPRTVTAGTVNLSLSVGLKIYERQGSVTLSAGDSWKRIPGFGAVRLVEGMGGSSRLIWRTALKSAELGWTYSFRDAVSEIVREGEWGGSVDILPQSPIVFQISPVHSYSGTVTAGWPTGVFTAKRLVATLRRVLNIRQIRLADYAVAAR
jgi:hypothetical protein